MYIYLQKADCHHPFSGNSSPPSMCCVCVLICVSVFCIIFSTGGKVMAYFVISPFSSHRSCQSFAPGHRNTCPLTRRLLASSVLILAISSSVSGSPSMVLARLLTYSASHTENGIGIAPLCTAHFRQIRAGWQTVTLCGCQ